jgi:uncharacterized OB-fold protein
MDGDVRQTGFLAPSIDTDSQPWWDAVAAHRLVLPRCGTCGRYWFPPTPGCPHCGAPDHELCAVSGRGRLYSWVVVQRALSPSFQADVPYTIALVELEEGARLFGRLFSRINPSARALVADAPVQAVFYEVSGQTLVGFELID